MAVLCIGLETGRLLAARRNPALEPLDRRLERPALPQNAASPADRQGDPQHLLGGVAYQLGILAHRELLDPRHSLPQLEAVAGIGACLAQHVRHDQGDGIGWSLEILSRFDPAALIEEIDPIRCQAEFRSNKYGSMDDLTLMASRSFHDLPQIRSRRER